jgi:GNAT superfamily N-acetyltransferase
MATRATATVPMPTSNASELVRLAEPADAPALARTLVRAYMDDPVAVWMCRAPTLRAKLLRALYSARLRELIGQCSVWTDGERSSLSVWVAPGRQPAGPHLDAELLRCLLDPRMTTRLPLVAAGFRGMQNAHPQERPHWYLSLLATDPAAQGRGLGSAVLEPVLERCDREGVGAYLESSKPRNLDFYARFHFHATGELKMPAGPTMWPMWREPRGRQARESCDLHA